MIGRSPRLIYSHSLNVTEEDLLGKMSYPPNNDLVKSFLINEGVSWNMVSYCERAHDSDLATWRRIELDCSALVNYASGTPARLISYYRDYANWRNQVPLNPTPPAARRPKISAHQG